MSAHKDFEVDTRPGIDDLTVTVELDDGTEMECMALTIFDLDNQNYIVLLPLDKDGNPAEEIVYIYKYFEDEEGNPFLDNIVSDEEYNRVSLRFDEIQDQLSSLLSSHEEIWMVKGSDYDLVRS